MGEIAKKMKITEIMILVFHSFQVANGIGFIIWCTVKAYKTLLSFN